MKGEAEVEDMKGEFEVEEMQVEHGFLNRFAHCYMFNLNYLGKYLSSTYFLKKT